MKALSAIFIVTHYILGSSAYTVIGEREPNTLNKVEEKIQETVLSVDHKLQDIIDKAEDIVDNTMDKVDSMVQKFDDEEEIAADIPNTIPTNTSMENSLTKTKDKAIKSAEDILDEAAKKINNKHRITLERACDIVAKTSKKTNSKANFNEKKNITNLEDILDKASEILNQGTIRVETIQVPKYSDEQQIPQAPRDVEYKGIFESAMEKVNRAFSKTAQSIESVVKTSIDKVDEVAHRVTSTLENVGQEVLPPFVERAFEKSVNVVDGAAHKAEKSRERVLDKAGDIALGVQDRAELAARKADEVTVVVKETILEVGQTFKDAMRKIRDIL